MFYSCKNNAMYREKILSHSEVNKYLKMYFISVTLVKNKIKFLVECLFLLKMSIHNN